MRVTEAMPALRTSSLRPIQCGIEFVARLAHAHDDDRSAGQLLLCTAVDVRQRDGFAVEARDPVQGVNGNAGFDQRPMDQGQLVGHECPGRGVTRGGDVGDVRHLSGQLLRHGAAHVVVVEVEHHHRSLRHDAGGQVVGRIDAGRGELTDRELQGGEKHLGPARSGGNDHMSMFQPENVVDAELAARVEVHIGPFTQLAHTPVGYTTPGRQPRETGLEAQPPTELLGGIRQGDRVAATRQG